MKIKTQIEVSNKDFYKAMKNTQDLKNKRRAGFYWLGDIPYVSVTNILKIIDKPQLRYWYGREVYLAMALDPSLSEHEALAAPYKKSKQAMSRGTTVHSIVEAYKHSKKHIDEDVAEEWKGYAKAYYRAIEELQIDVVGHEKTVINQKERYSGTLDVLAYVGQKKTPMIIDIKTGKDIYPDYALQVSAYKHAITDFPVQDCAVLLLKDDGKYKWEIMNDEYEAFLAAKKLWEGVNREMLQKIGYFK